MLSLHLKSSILYGTLCEKSSWSPHRVQPYILKAKKFAEPPFQSKKIAEKVRVIFGPFWVILVHFGPFLVILGHFWSFRIILDHFWAILGYFWLFWFILGHFWSFLAIMDHFWAILVKIPNIR